MDPDVVLSDAFYPMFRGSHEETCVWLKERDPTDYTVCLGETAAVISAKAFLKLYDRSDDDQSGSGGPTS